MPIDEKDIENADLGKVKEALRFLITQEKIRQQEVEALKEMVSGIDKYSKDYVDGQNFNAFKEKFGDKLSAYDSSIEAAESQPSDFTRDTFNAYKELEEPKPTEEEFVEEVVKNADEYLANLKNALGIPADAAVAVESDAEGNLTVKADENGDGKAEETVVEAEKVDAPVEEKAEEEAPAEENADEGISEEDKKDIDEAVDNYKPRH